MPLTLAPVRETAPKEILTGRPMNVLNVATLDIPDHSNRHLAMSVDLRPLSVSHVSFHTFHLALATPVTCLEPRLGGCNSSSFLKGLMKMAHVDIDPFGEHNETDAQPDTGKTIPFTQGGVIDKGSNWEPEQETSFGEGKTQSTRLKETFVRKLYQ